MTCLSKVLLFIMELQRNMRFLGWYTCADMCSGSGMSLPVSRCGSGRSCWCSYQVLSEGLLCAMKRSPRVQVGWATRLMYNKPDDDMLQEADDDLGGDLGTYSKDGRRGRWPDLSAVRGGLVAGTRGRHANSKWNGGARDNWSKAPLGRGHPCMGDSGVAGFTIQGCASAAPAPEPFTLTLTLTTCSQSRVVHERNNTGREIPRLGNPGDLVIAAGPNHQLPHTSQLQLHTARNRSDTSQPRERPQAQSPSLGHSSHQRAADIMSRC